ncbi:MAG: hypothetical protein JW850_20495 [Thermoflexales bacterium]|nr:hypothetical protein [Thermoflexales bacterium]
MNKYLFQTGDRVFHPMYGVGVIEGLTTRDKIEPPGEYYAVRLPQGAVLSVPVTKANDLGLRRIANSLSTIVACLRSPAHPLPNDDRQRAAELKTRARLSKPGALSQAVRDLVCYSHTHKLKPADKNWLAAACERLSAEAAWVDAIDPGEAQATIRQEIDHMRPS